MPRTPTKTSPLDTEVVGRLRLAVMRLARRLRQQSLQGEITPSLLSALSSIEHHEPVSLGRLAAIERVQPPSITRIVARLEELGYVARVVDPDDRRSARVSLTPEGRRFSAQARTARTAYLAERMVALTARERAALEAALPVLERLIGDDEDAGEEDR